MIAGASTSVLATVSTGTSEAVSIAVVVLTLVAGISIFRSLYSIFTGRGNTNYGDK